MSEKNFKLSGFHYWQRKFIPGVDPLQIGQIVLYLLLAQLSEPGSLRALYPFITQEVVRWWADDA